MPLPPFGNFAQVWIEKTKTSHQHGGAGWEFGTCLWSPVTNKAGHKSYENMTRVQPGDLVLHICEDRWFGLVDENHFCGYSIADKAYVIRQDEPPHPSNWTGQAPYYRVDLRDFTTLPESVPTPSLVRDYRARILEAAQEKGGPFINYNGQPRLAQGAYLSRCSQKLYDIFSETVAGQYIVPPPAVPVGVAEKEAHAFITENIDEYMEGQRMRKESSYFRRHKKLVADAKARDRYRCQACNLYFPERYGELGEQFIECHHLDPLSEREDADAKTTRLEKVACLCSNCHRMIHRYIKKMGRAVSIEEFRRTIK